MVEVKLNLKNTGERRGFDAPDISENVTAGAGGTGSHVK